MQISPTHYGPGNSASVLPISRYAMRPIHSFAAVSSWVKAPEPGVNPVNGSLGSVVNSTEYGSTWNPAVRKHPTARGICEAEVTNTHLSLRFGLSNAAA